MSDETHPTPEESLSERLTTAFLLAAMVVGGGFATIALAIGASDLLTRYGGL